MSLLGQAPVVMLLVAALLALRPLAEATPPDQTWLAGLYDDADHDDVVLSVMGVTAAVEAGPVDLSGPASICLGAVTPVQRQAVPAAPFDVRSGRSPPQPPDS